MAEHEAEESAWLPDARHQKLVEEKLSAHEVEKFVDALERRIADRFSPKDPPSGAKGIASWFARSDLGNKKSVTYFDLVRQAMRDCSSGQDLDLLTRSAVSEAASALYCLAACRLVDRSARQGNGFVIRVPKTESIIYAVITTALFGGQLHLRGAEGSDLPTGAYVFKVRAPTGGQDVELAFERAVYVALFRNRGDITEIAQDDGPLTEEQRADLAVELHSITETYDNSLALIVQGTTDGQCFAPFVTEYEVPVLLPDELAQEVLKLPPALLRAYLKKFWKEMREFSEGGAQKGVQFSDLRVAHLITILTELRNLVSESAPLDQRESLQKNLGTAVEEAAKPDLNSDLIKRLLEGTHEQAKKWSGTVQNSGKIVQTANRAIEYLTSIGTPAAGS